MSIAWSTSRQAGRKNHLENDFLKRLEKEVLFADGAMGTMLQAKGLKSGECPEEWNITYKEEVQNIHRAYLGAGSDIILTNTFGGNYFKLKKRGLQDRVGEFNLAAAQLAREAISNYQSRSAFRQARYVAGDIGPTGEFAKPVGDFDPQDFYKAFKEQILVLVEGGVDLIIIETMSALEEVEAALRAARENTKLPLISSMSFSSGQRGFRTIMGVSVEGAVEGMLKSGADVIGANCGDIEPDQMSELISQMRKHTKSYLIAQSNAGRPKLIRGETVFDESAEEMAQSIPKLIEAGVNIIGGCCGTTPGHLSKMVEKARKRK
jgi:5-methyltetrahydrofolate--homocysteine methyltransferase